MQKLDGKAFREFIQSNQLPFNRMVDLETGTVEQGEEKYSTLSSPSQRRCRLDKRTSIQELRLDTAICLVSGYEKARLQALGVDGGSRGRGLRLRRSQTEHRSYKNKQKRNSRVPHL
jgi:hypothetical protein